MFRRIADMVSTLFSNTLYTENLNKVLEFTYDTPPNVGNCLIFTKGTYDKNAFIITVDIAQKDNSGFRIGWLNIKNDGTITATIPSKVKGDIHIESKNFSDVMHGIANETRFKFYLKAGQPSDPKNGDIVRAAFSEVSSPPSKDIAKKIAEYLGPEDLKALKQVNKDAWVASKAPRK